MTLKGAPRVLELVDQTFLADLERRLATAERDRDEARAALDRVCVLGRYCPRHHFIHGAEAEELREELAKTRNTKVLRVLERVDARDSLAWAEWRANEERLDAEADAAELAANAVSIPGEQKP